MKILAIRGKNLASLAGHFEVDFDSPPLDRAGLLAITGPTGAGKTTLLDAMCLALFDRTPRFANRGGVVIGGEGDEGGLRANDVRGILRHGAVEGWAEVDFLGVDGRRWRARWEIRRARGRAEGRVQQQQMKLIDPLDGSTVSADRKLDVLAAIEARLGLDFDQFRRSVLLAQGEFAAFLEASGGERAELLERMTGTSLYRELGRAAHERARLAEQERALLERERAQLRILAAEERRELEGRVTDLRQKRSAIRARREAIETALRWHEREAELEAGLQEARAELEAVAGEVGALDELEGLLGRVEVVAPIRERIAARDRLSAEEAECRRDLEFVAGELPLIEAARVEVAGRVELHGRELERARERRRRLTPELERARELDSRTRSLEAERDRVELRRLELDRQRAEIGERLERIELSIGQARTRLAEAQRWVEARGGLVLLAQEWGHHRSLLHQQRKGLLRRRELRARVRELGPRRDRLRQDHEGARGDYDEARRRRSQAATRARKVERELAERPTLAELGQRQRGLERDRERLTRLERLREQHQRCAASLAELELDRRAQIVERDHRAGERRRVEAELQGIGQAFVEAQRGLRKLEAVRDLATHRAELVAGEPCPLCGATEHPHGAAGGPVDEVVETQRQHVEALLRQRDELGREQAEHQSRGQIAGQRLATLERQSTQQRRELEGLQRQWGELVAEGLSVAGLRGEGEGEAEGEAETSDEPQQAQLQLLAVAAGPVRARGNRQALPERLGDDRLDAALWAVRDRLERAAAALEREQRETLALVDRQRERAARREACERRAEECRAELTRIERELEGSTRELDELAERSEQLEAELDERWTELCDVGPAALAALSIAEVERASELAGEELVAQFRRRLEDGGEELIAELDEAVDRLRSRQFAIEQAVEGLRALETRRIQLSSQASARAEQQHEQGAEREALDEQLAQVVEARSKVLEGRPVAVVARELDAAIEHAERDRDAASEELARVERSLQGDRARLHALEARMEDLHARHHEAASLVELSLAEAGLPGEELAALLARTELWAEGWASQARARLDRGRARIQRQRAVVDERARVLADHRARRPPSPPRATSEEDGAAQELDREPDEDAVEAGVEAGDGAAQLEASLARVSAREAALDRELFDLDHRLRSDDEAREHERELAPRLREQEHAAAVWGRLREAIGSASGDKFQKFAQSLTLELLLAQANAKLRELKPRYTLGRVPRHDLELQLIDHDLGDEVRSIRGLSGGEKFLVSLALALGLASLSADDCRIDSLFIDEGFGTLDARSLDVAVSTLDALQAEGRQIGVISHVPGLAERVGVEVRVEPVSSGRSRVRVVC